MSPEPIHTELRARSVGELRRIDLAEAFSESHQVNETVVPIENIVGARYEFAESLGQFA